MRPDDLEELVTLWRRAREEAQPALERRMGHSREDDVRQLRAVAASADVWVADGAERPLGFLALRGAHLDQLYVDPPAQSRGVGGALLAKAKELAPLGLTLFTHLANARARRFYEARGFRAVAFGTSPPPESEPDVRYAWDPAAGPETTDPADDATRARRGRLRVLVRPESPADADAIRSLTARAFAGLSFSDGTEPLVIDGLRDDGALTASLVAELEGAVIGHVAFSRVDAPGPGAWFALGPVSVEPRLQRRGVGSALIRAGLETLRDRGAAGCVLVGDPRYYGRFGFAVAPDFAALGYPPEHFQMLRFGDALPGGPVAFHRAFSVETDPSARADRAGR